MLDELFIRHKENKLNQYEQNSYAVQSFLRSEGLVFRGKSFESWL
eukprot:UN06017